MAAPIPNTQHHIFNDKEKYFRMEKKSRLISETGGTIDSRWSTIILLLLHCSGRLESIVGCSRSNQWVCSILKCTGLGTWDWCCHLFISRRNKR